MFCRIEILTRDAKKVTRIGEHFRSTTTSTEAEEFASKKCRQHNGHGFRVLNIHTGEMKEVWD